MSSLGGLVIFLSSFLCLFFCEALIFRICAQNMVDSESLQKVMASQGIRALVTDLSMVHQRMSNMRKEAMSSP
ncbi:hypothetical protein M0R45_020102 [Rubus argutus]|uniref:Uncharacterized protein n=1 Tax=Rubus argutus TaxID=59490 RepID=A0AAW1X7B0_RUBAR